MIEQLATEYFHSRPNRDLPKAKLAVLFLASSGSGKSTIRQLLVDKLGTTYFCNDEVRALLARHKQDMTPKVVIDATWEQWRQRAANQCIVFDSNMSSSYMHPTSYYHAAKRHGYQTCIIRIDLPHEE